MCTTKGPGASFLCTRRRSKHYLYVLVIKILAPGLRLGYIYAKPPMLDRLLARRSDAGSTLCAAITASFIKTALPRTPRLRPCVAGQTRSTLKGLEEELGDTCVWSVPVGGLFIGFAYPTMSQQTLGNVARTGCGLLPGQSFQYQRQDVPYLRLAFGHLTPNQITTGLPIWRDAFAVAGSNEARNFNRYSSIPTT